MENDIAKNLFLYSDNRLPCPQRVLLTAAELGIELKLIPIDILKNEHKTPEYSTLTNSFSAVPFLTDSTTPPPFTLRESRAIARYLCALHPSPLLPYQSDLPALAKFEEAASHEVTSFDPIANRLAFEAYFKPLFGGSTDEGVVRELRERLKGVLDEMERMLGEDRERGGRTYMAGDTFTLSDVFYIPYMLKLSVLYGEEMFAGREKLKVWWERVNERPTVKLLKTYKIE